MRRRKKPVDHSQARTKAIQSFGTDVLIFADLSVGESFYFASAEPGDVCTKVRKTQYRFQDRIFNGRASQPVRRKLVSA